MDVGVSGLAVAVCLEPNNSPLLHACCLGDLKAAKHLLEKCQANANCVGSINFNNVRIDEATPLWIAAAIGNMNLVETLIRYKAHLNSTTSSNSTPLRAACYGGHLEIVKYLIEHGANFEIATRYGHTCLMIACFRKHYEIVKYLLECGADVNRKSKNGSTALHECSQSGSLDIIKMLLKHGIKFQCNCTGISPLLIAASAGEELIVEYFLKELNLTKLEVIHALELLGAGCIGTRGDATKVLHYWRCAMKLRLEEDEFPLDVPLTPLPFAAFVVAKEANTLFKLEELFDTSNESVTVIGNATMRHAVLIRERILGLGSSARTVLLRSDNGKYIHFGILSSFIPCWMHILVTEQESNEPLNKKTVKNLLVFSEFFSCLLSQALRKDDSAHIFLSGERPFSFQSILDVFQRALMEIERALGIYQNDEIHLRYNFEFHSILGITLHLIGLMCKLDPIKREKSELKELVIRLIDMDPTSKNGWKLLHIACFKDSSYYNRFPLLMIPSVEVVDLLLELGVCPNISDLSQNYPLHIAAMDRTCTPAVYISLLKHGAHSDLRNSKGQTPLQLAKLYESALSDIYFDYMKLQCLSAQVVQAYNITYEGVVPKKVQKFLENH